MQYSRAKRCWSNLWESSWEKQIQLIYSRGSCWILNPHATTWGYWRSISRHSKYYPERENEYHFRCLVALNLYFIPCNIFIIFDKRHIYIFCKIVLKYILLRCSISFTKYGWYLYMCLWYSFKWVVSLLVSKLKWNKHTI